MLNPISTLHSVASSSLQASSRQPNSERTGNTVPTSSVSKSRLLNTVKIAALYMLAIQGGFLRIPKAQAERFYTGTHPQANVPVRVDERGDFIKDSHGNMVVFDASTQLPILDRLTGMPTVIDRHTGAVTVFRRPALPNDSPVDMVRNALQNGGVKHKEPALIRQELFDEYGVLDPAKLETAMKNYAAEDIYTALIAASRYEEWGDVKETWTVQKDGSQTLSKLGLKWADIRIPDRRQATLILVALLAFSRQNAPYANTKDGKVPTILLTAKAMKQDSAVTALPWHTAFVQNDLSDDVFVTRTFHELCHLHESPGCRDMIVKALEKHPILKGTGYAVTAYYRIMEGMAEFATNRWNGDLGDTLYETHPDIQAHKITMALVSALSRDTGNPADCKITDDDMRRGAMDKVTDDLNPGIDVLYRACFIGDPAAMAKLEYAVNSLVEQPGFHDPSAYYAALKSKPTRDRSEL